MKLIDDERNIKIELTGRGINGKPALVVHPPEEYIDRRMVQVQKYLNKYEHINPDAPHSKYFLNGQMVSKTKRGHLEDCLNIITSVVHRDSTDEDYRYVWKDLAQYREQVGQAEHEQYLQYYNHVADKYCPGIQQLSDEKLALLVKDMVKKKVIPTLTHYDTITLRSFFIALAKEHLEFHQRSLQSLSSKRREPSLQQAEKNIQ